MTSDPKWLDTNDTVDEAARRLAEHEVGAMPVCDGDQLCGMVTDRDIVVKVIAKGDDPMTIKVGQLAEGKPVTIGADDSVDELVRTMRDHDVRRLPVIDGNRLVGVVAQADVATELGAERAGELLADISAAPANA